MINENRLLNEANFFTQRKFDKAFFYTHCNYHQIFQIIKSIKYMHFFAIFQVKMKKSNVTL
jgi:hypothetical protein